MNTCCNDDNSVKLENNRQDEAKEDGIELGCKEGIKHARSKGIEIGRSKQKTQIVVAMKKCEAK